MQFSLAKLFLITVFVSLVLAATFAFPSPIGHFTLLFLAAIVLPAFVIVGVVNTRGVRQSFFLGAMVTGIPHFVYCVYSAMVTSAMIAGGQGMNIGEVTSETDVFQNLFHAVAMLFGCLGGLSGMAAYGWITMGRNQKKPTIECDL